MKNKAQKILSAGLVALLGARMISVFLHFSSVPHVINHESGHREGIHGCEHHDDDRYKRITGESYKGFLLNVTVALVESREGHGSFKTHYCSFEDCLTEHYDHESRCLLCGVADSLALEEMSASEKSFGSSKIFLFTAPKNSPPV